MEKNSLTRENILKKSHYGLNIYSHILRNEYPDDEIINISMADGLSGTYQTACGAKAMMEEDAKITVFNSRTLCGPHRYMVERAQEMKKAGCTAKEILDWLEMAADKTESFLIPQDFEFLKNRPNFFNFYSSDFLKKF